MMTTLLLSIIVVSWIAVSLSSTLSDALSNALSNLSNQLLQGLSKSYELVPVRVKDQSDRSMNRGTAYRNR